MSTRMSGRVYKLTAPLRMSLVNNDDHITGAIEAPEHTVCKCIRRRNVPRAHGYASGNSIEEYGSAMVEDQGYICNCTVNGRVHYNVLLLDSDIEAGYAVPARMSRSPRLRRIARRTVRRSGKPRRSHTRHANRTHH